jgi:5,10-methylenetetrahydrofolate reductase
MLKSSGGVYPRLHKFDYATNSSIKVLLHLKVKAGINRFFVQAYFVVRVFKG